MAWKIGYYIFMETAVLVYNLVQRLHHFPERNRCVLTLFSPWMTPDGGYSLRELLKKHLFTIFILDFILFSKNCVLNTVSFRLKKTFISPIHEKVSLFILSHFAQAFLIISQTKRDRNCNFVKQGGRDKLSSLLYEDSNIVMRKLIISWLKEFNWLQFSLLIAVQRSVFLQIVLNILRAREKTHRLCLEISRELIASSTRVKGFLQQNAFFWNKVHNDHKGGKIAHCEKPKFNEGKKETLVNM